MVGIAAIIGLLMSGSFFLQSFIPPVKRSSDYLFNDLMPNRMLPIADALELRRRGILDEDGFNFHMRKEGFDTQNAERLWEASETLVSAEALLVLLWRKEITQEQYKTRMALLGFTDNNSNLFAKSREFYPTPTDLVMWQAKEVFEKDAIKKYGLDNEYELIDKEAFYKAGMTEEQIKNYWMAHWQHPSLQMIYQMLHRGELTQEDVYEYFRLVEIPPYWRNKLIETSYPPYTRVDTRRMYEMGVLSREQVKRNYLDLGYDEEKAENMTIFTVAYSTQKDRDLTRTQIEKAYEYGILKDVEAVKYLEDLGYDEEESLFILGLKAYSIMQEELDDKVATIKTQFRRGLIQQSEAIAELDKLEISPTFRDKTIAEILRVKQTEFQLPSKADVGNWLLGGLINEEQFISYMDRLGFQETEINIYLESFKL